MLRVAEHAHRLTAPDVRAPTGAGIAGPVLAATAGAGGDGALRVARLLAARRGERPTVVSVLDPQPPAVMVPDLAAVPPGFDALRLDARRAEVERQVRDVVGLDDGPEIAIVIGDPGHALAAEARRRGAGLVVVGRGRHDVATRLLGDETELRILRRVECPVLAVPETQAALPRVAVAAVDFSPLCVAAAQAALDVLDAGGTLRLLHVWAPLDGGDAWAMERNARYAERLPARFARVRDALRVRPGVTVSTVALETAPGTRAIVEALLGHAARLHAELVAVGRQSHGVLERLLVGSVATSVIRGAPCAVLAVPMPPPAVAESLARHMRGGYEAHDAAAWTVALDRFVQRNAGRRTRLERSGPGGVHAQQSGHPLLGAAWDPHDRRVELMFGEPGARAHLTHSIADPTTVAVVGDDARGDVALRVDHEGGWTLVTFLPPDEGGGAPPVAE
jgi:nucleotide-binding universal stress UspA family protein